MNILNFFVLYIKTFIRRTGKNLQAFFPTTRYTSKHSNFPISGFSGTFLKIALIVLIICGIFISFTFFYRNLNIRYFCPVISEGTVGIVNQNNLPPQITVLLSEPLFYFDNKGIPKQNLVESWSVNNENTVYTIKLKNNLYWNDKTKVKSSDLDYNLRDVEVSYPDENTLVFKLADSFSPFLSLLTNPVFKKNTLIGMGKYNVTEIDYNHLNISKLFLSPLDNENCHDFPKIKIRFYSDEETLKTAFLLGEIDVLLNVQNKDTYTNIPGIKFSEKNDYQKLVLIYYNTQDKLLMDKNLRKALNSATPVGEGSASAKTSIPPNSWAYSDAIKNLKGDKESAKLYFSKLENKDNLSLILTATSQFSQLAEKIVSEWKKAGINAVVRVESGMPQNFQILLTQTTIPHDPDQYALWHSTQTNSNLSKFSSPRVDKDLEDARKLSDPEKRKEKYLDFQKEIADDTPATFLYFETNTTVYRNKVQNNLNKIYPLQFPGL